MNLMGRLRIVKVLKPTKAKMFGNLVEGDILSLTIPFEAPGQNRGKPYATNVKAVCDRTKESITLSLTEIQKRLSSFEWKKVLRYLVMHKVDNGSLFCISNVGVFEGEVWEEVEERAKKTWNTTATLDGVELDYLPENWSYLVENPETWEATKLRRV